VPTAAFFVEARDLSTSNIANQGADVKRYICSIPNTGLDGPIRELFYSDDVVGYAQAEEFARREDRPGRSVYDAVNLFHDDATSRRIATVAALTCVHVDIDLKDTEIDREEALRRIKSLEYPPDLVVDSGHGFHLYYRFRRRYRVWVWNGEDDIDEMERRISAICEL
jgi:hypothetical protein